jgi:hypothetical protein
MLQELNTSRLFQVEKEFLYAAQVLWQYRQIHVWGCRFTDLFPAMD